MREPHDVLGLPEPGGPLKLDLANSFDNHQCRRNIVRFMFVPVLATLCYQFMLSSRHYGRMFVTRLATQYFPNHIVLSAGTRNSVIDLDVARFASPRLPHCICLLLRRPVLLYFRRSFCIFGMNSINRSKKGDSSKCK